MDLRRSNARPLNQQRPPWQKRCQIFSQLLALEAAEKNHVEAGRGFDLKFVWAFIGLSYRSVMSIKTSSQTLSASTWFFSAASMALGCSIMDDIQGGSGTALGVLVAARWCV